MPTGPSATRFYITLLHAAGAPAGRLRSNRPRVAGLERHASSWLCEIDPDVLIIDELHNLLAAIAPRRREFPTVLRFLGNELRIPLVGVGSHEAYLAIRSDGQLENRFDPCRFHARIPMAKPARCWPASPRHSRYASPH